MFNLLKGFVKLERKNDSGKFEVLCVRESGMYLNVICSIRILFYM